MIFVKKDHQIDFVEKLLLIIKKHRESKTSRECRVKYVSIIEYFVIHVLKLALFYCKTR